MDTAAATPVARPPVGGICGRPGLPMTLMTSLSVCVCVSLVLFTVGRRWIGKSWMDGEDLEIGVRAGGRGWCWMAAWNQVGLLCLLFLCLCWRGDVGFGVGWEIG